MILIGHWHVRIFLILVGLGVSIHLLMLKTIKKSEMLLPELKNMKEVKE